MRKKMGFDGAWREAKGQEGENEGVKEEEEEEEKGG